MYRCQDIKKYPLQRRIRYNRDMHHYHRLVGQIPIKGLSKFIIYLILLFFIYGLWWIVRVFILLVVVMLLFIVSKRLRTPNETENVYFDSDNPIYNIKMEHFRHLNMSKHNRILLLINGHFSISSGEIIKMKNNTASLKFHFNYPLHIHFTTEHILSILCR